MLEPFGEVGGDVPEYFLSQTHFANIEDKKLLRKIKSKNLQLEFNDLDWTGIYAFKLPGFKFYHLNPHRKINVLLHISLRTLLS